MHILQQTSEYSEAIGHFLEIIIENHDLSEDEYYLPYKKIVKMYYLDVKLKGIKWIIHELQEKHYECG